MGLRTGFLLAVVVLIAALAALNWGILATPVLMSIGFMQVNAPLGVIMLGLTVLLGILFAAYVVYLQSSVLIETRRHTKELQGQCDLADKATSSRPDRRYAARLRGPRRRHRWYRPRASHPCAGSVRLP